MGSKLQRKRLVLMRVEVEIIQQIVMVVEAPTIRMVLLTPVMESAPFSLLSMEVFHLATSRE